ncbi:hypothetical protein [Mammaliicoccus sciuri]|uniref:hypothetical protein n=2 Tax=Mammaliicoccus TaxID=2803850 RepID=UPI002737E575|nr:hypothetical protein [Mammaliicoccus sciuri]
MEFKQIKQILEHDKTMYVTKGGIEMAINEELGLYISKSEGVFAVNQLENNDIDFIESSDSYVELIGIKEVSELTNTGRMTIKYRIENNVFKKMPKPFFVLRQSRGDSHFWLRSQFEDKKE